MKINLNSIGLKVLLAYIVGVLLSVTLVIIGSIYLFIYQGSYIVGLDTTELARKQAQKLKFDSAGFPIGIDPENVNVNWFYESLKEEMAYRVMDESGNTVLASAAGKNFWLTEDSTLPLNPNYHQFERDGNLYHTATATVKHNGKVWHFQFAMSVRYYYLMHKGLALPRMGLGIILFSLVLLFVFGICAYITLGYTLRPLREISESASEISPRSMHTRLNIQGLPYEIIPLVESFNRVLDRLEQGFRVQQEFLATAAHELKTPLSLIRAQIELKDKSDDRDHLLNDIQHMTRQVQQLLLLAEVSEPQNYNLTKVDAESVVDELMAYLNPMAKAANVQIRARQHAPSKWIADRSAFFILLKNLVENAIQHAPHDTEILIELNASALSVKDSGPGIEQDKIQNIFTRFWRGASRRDLGAGLGLSICQEITQAHGWELTAIRENPGMRFLLTQTPALKSH